MSAFKKWISTSCCQDATNPWDHLYRQARNFGCAMAACSCLSLKFECNCCSYFFVWFFFLIWRAGLSWEGCIHLSILWCCLSPKYLSVNVEVSDLECWANFLKMSIAFALHSRFPSLLVCELGTKTDIGNSAPRKVNIISAAELLLLWEFKYLGICTSVLLIFSQLFF